MLAATIQVNESNHHNIQTFHKVTNLVRTGARAITALITQCLSSDSPNRNLTTPRLKKKSIKRTYKKQRTQLAAAIVTSTNVLHKTSKQVDQNLKISR